VSLTIFTGSCRYSRRIAKRKSARLHATTFLSVDLLFYGSQEAHELDEQGYRPVQDPDYGRLTSNRSFGEAVDFLTRIAKTGHVKARQKQLGVKLIVPLQAGYVMWSDFLPKRLAFCEICDFAESVLNPAQHVSAYEPSTDHRDDLNKLLDHAVGAVVVKSSVSGSLDMSMEAMDVVLPKRLRNPWIVPNLPLRLSMSWQN
jgi:hypothetical protein